MAYAAVMFLGETLLPGSDPIHLNHDPIVYLVKELSFLKSFMEESQDKEEYDVQVVKDLERKISDADIIDSQLYISKARPAALRPPMDFGRKRISMIAYKSFTEIINEIKAVRMEIERLFENKVSDGNSATLLLSSPTPSSEKKLVGIDAGVEKLRERLSGPSLHRLVIPIVGMGGIGKTTLADTIYNDRLSFLYPRVDHITSNAYDAFGGSNEGNVIGSFEILFYQYRR